MTTELNIGEIRTDGGTQPRANIDPDLVEEYAELIQNKVTLPPVVVFYDGEGYWLADGFHRYHAHTKVGLKVIVCDVRMGTVREAVLYSVGANETHGKRRSIDDKRRAVKRLLQDEEWCKWSDYEIGRRCRVSHTFVGKMRQLTPPPATGPAFSNVAKCPQSEPASDKPKRKMRRGGKVIERSATRKRKQKPTVTIVPTPKEEPEEPPKEPEAPAQAPEEDEEGVDWPMRLDNIRRAIAAVEDVKDRFGGWDELEPLWEVLEQLKRKYK